MSVILSITHEAGNLNEWEGNSGGDVSASASAALAGTNYGLAVLANDTTSDFMYKGVTTNTSGKLRFRFYIDPNSMTITASSDLIVVGLRSTTPAYVSQINLSYYSSLYKISASAMNDAGGSGATSLYTITDEPHYVEIYLQRASSNVASDGSIQLWIDGVSKQTVTGIDNYDRFVNYSYLYLGLFSQSLCSGTIYLDQIVINDDGSEIGPVSVSSAIPHRMALLGVGR